nr:hypothetical protein [Streptomyces pratensis]
MSQASSPPDILSPAFAADPYGAYRAMRESAPLIHHGARRRFPSGSPLWAAERRSGMRRPASTPGGPAAVPVLAAPAGNGRGHLKSVRGEAC